MGFDLKVELMNAMEISLFIFLSLSIDLWVISDDDKFIVEISSIA